jgi:sugar phosphate isomerase/epimerase
LAQLLEAEARLEEMLRRAREEAAGLLTSAREATAAREAALAAELDALSHQLEATIADERHRQEQDLVESARREALRFDQTGPEQIEALARYVVERVIGVEP